MAEVGEDSLPSGKGSYMTIATQWAAAALLVAASGLHALDGDIPVDPVRMKVGESACVFPVHISNALNVWVSKKAVYRRTDGFCILKLTRTAAGFEVAQDGVPIMKYAAAKEPDATYRDFGWLMIGHAASVLK